MALDLSPLRVLVVDDEPAITKLVSMLLADMGVTRVTVAKTGQDAKWVLEREHSKIDVVICDWNMPEVSGLDLLQWIRSSDPKLPFIFVTSRGDIESVRTAGQHGVSDYLLKPFKREQLYAKLAKQSRGLLATKKPSSVVVW